jgi:hypothetical protein
MADPTSYPENEHSSARQPPRPVMPRWVKVSLVIAILLALAFVVTWLLGIQHGPSLHEPPQGYGDHLSSIEQPVDRP